MLNIAKLLRNSNRNCVFCYKSKKSQKNLLTNAANEVIINKTD